MKIDIEDEWVGIWNNNITRYAGEKTLTYEMKCKEGAYKVVAAQIHTTKPLYDALFKCEAVYWIYINGKQLWCYPVVKEMMQKKFGVDVWERTFPIPFNIVKDDVICCQITDIEIPKNFPSGYGINCILSGYKRKI